MQELRSRALALQERKSSSTSVSRVQEVVLPPSQLRRVKEALAQQNYIISTCKQRLTSIEQKIEQAEHV